MNNFSASRLKRTRELWFSLSLLTWFSCNGLFAWNAYSHMACKRRQQYRESLLLRSSSLLQLLVWTRSNARHSNVAFGTLHCGSSLFLIHIKLGIYYSLDKVRKSLAGLLSTLAADEQMTSASIVNTMLSYIKCFRTWKNTQPRLS